MNPGIPSAEDNTCAFHKPQMRLAGPKLGDVDVMVLAGSAPKVSGMAAVPASKRHQRWDECRDAWTDGRSDGWTDGWIDG